jgi:hypothetical protein
MSESSFIHSWVTLFGSLAIIAIILAALGFMLGIVKLADAPRNIGAILGIMISLMLFPGVLLCAWFGMSLWQQLTLIAIAIGVLYWLRPRGRTQNERRD